MWSGSFVEGWASYTERVMAEQEYPGDGDPRAAYAVLDTDVGTVTFYRAPYQVDETQRRIHARGLPEMFADRLAFGI